MCYPKPTDLMRRELTTISMCRQVNRTRPTVLLLLWTITLVVTGRGIEKKGESRGLSQATYVLPSNRFSTASRAVTGRKVFSLAQWDFLCHTRLASVNR